MQDNPNTIQAIQRDNMQLRQQVQQQTQALAIQQQRTKTLLYQASVIDQVHASIVVTDLDGIITIWPRGAERLFGYRADEMLGRHISIVYSSDEQAFLQHQVIAPLKQKGYHTTVVRMKHKSGATFHAHLSLSLLRDEEGIPVGMIGNAVDFSERMRLEQELRVLSTLVEAAPDSIGITDPQSGCITYANRAYQESTGYGEDLLGMVLTDAYDDDPAYIRQLVQHVFQHGSWRGVLTFRRRDGSTFKGQLSAMAICDSSGQPQAVAGIVRDITEQLALEHALRESQELLQGLLENLPSAVFVRDTNGRFLLVNQQYETMFQTSRDALIGKTMEEAFAPETARILREHDQQLLDTGAPFTIEEQFVQEDGVHTYLKIRFPLLDEDGTIYALAGISTDITAQKEAEALLRQAHDELDMRVQERTAELSHLNAKLHAEIIERERAEEALREREAYYRALVYNATDLVSICDRAGYVRYISPSVSRILGYRPEELIGRSSFDLLHPDDIPRISESFATKTEHPDHNPTVELRFRHRDGSWRDLEAITTNLLDHPDIAGMVVNARDVTDRNRAERERHSLFQLSRDMLCIVGFDGRLKQFNPAWTHIFGYSEDELKAERLSAFTHPDDQEMTQQQIRKLVDGQQVVSFENRHRCKDGSYRWLLWNATSEPERGLTYAVARDITERKRNEEQLALLGQAVQHASDAVLITDAHLDPPGPQIVFVNPAFCRMSSYAPEDIIGQTPRILQGPDTDTEPLQQLKQALVQGEPFTGETVNYRQDGTPYHVEWRISPIRNDAGTITHYVSVQRDVTARAYAHMLETDRQAVLEAMVRGETFSAVLRRIVQMLEHQFPQIHGAIEVYSNNHLLYQVAPNLPSTYRAALDSLRETRQGVPWEGSFIQHQMMIIDDIASERRWRRWCTLALEHSFQSCWMIPIVQPADNTYGVVILYASEPVSPDAHAAALIETARQMTALALEWQRLNERLIYHVSHDALTGLPNRIHFLEHVQQTIVQAKPAEHMLAVCFIDLDRFTRINDTLGHIVGDQVLQHVATRFQATIQESDILARIGDDTFALMLTSVHNVRDAVHSAQQLLATLDAPFHIEERNLFLTASIGISFYPQDGSDAQILLNNADGALHRAKVNGVNTVMCFAPEMTTLALERLEMENQLRVALNQGGLMVYYQPQIDLMSGKVVGVEGLIRWRHPKRGIISPANFIPLAEESGLIIPMGAWILQEVCRQAMVWQRAGLPPMRVAVNISALQLEHEDFVAHVTHALQSSGLDPALLDLEITESIMMRDHETGALRLRQVEELGVRVSIDDFGTGYSSLAYLQQLPVDCLKIDRVFIHNLTREEVTASNRPQNMTALVQTVVTLAHNFGLKVIAEGIDSPAQVAYLRQIGCDEGQGFLFGKPMPARDLEALLRQRAHMVDFFCLPSDTVY